MVLSKFGYDDVRVCFSAADGSCCYDAFRMLTPPNSILLWLKNISSDKLLYLADQMEGWSQDSAIGVSVGHSLKDDPNPCFFRRCKDNQSV